MNSKNAILVTIFSIFLSCFGFNLNAQTDFVIPDNIEALGTLSVAGATTIESNQILDVTDIEAFLVRKNADAGDIFTVDTTTPFVTANSILYINGGTTGDSLRTGGDFNTSLNIFTFSTPGPSLYFNAAKSMRIGTGTNWDATGYLELWRIGNVASGGIISLVNETIDITNTEAFLVRQGGNAGDVFAVDTTNTRILVGTPGSDGDDETPPELLTLIGGNLEVFDQGTLGAENLTDGDMSSTTNWAGATDWSDTISGTTTYTHSAGSGTLTQTSAQRSITGKNSRWYKLTYTVSSVTDVGANVLTITNAFAAATVTLDIDSNATRSVIFQSNSSASSADFVLSATSDTASDTFTLDDLILKEVIGGNVIVAGKLTGGGTLGILIDSDGNGLFEGPDNKFGVDGTVGKITLLGSIAELTLTSTGYNGNLSVSDTGSINLQINGGTKLSINTNTILFMVPQEIDLNDTEAFLVRKNSDAGDVFAVDTTNTRILVGTPGSDGDDETPPELFTSIGGSIEVFDAGTLGAETLTDGGFPNSTNWAGATDWSDTISGTTTYTHSAGSGTLTQTAAQRVTGNEGSDSRWYKFTYTVSSVTNVGANVLTITNAFAASAVTLDISSAATRSVIFQAHATNADTADFVLSATSDTASDTFTLDDLILKEITGGDIIVAGKLTGGGSNGISVDNAGAATLSDLSGHSEGSVVTVDANGKLQTLGSLLWTSASKLGLNTVGAPAVPFHMRNSSAGSVELMRIDNEWAAAGGGPQVSFYNQTEIGNFKWRIVDADSDDAYFTIEVIEGSSLVEKLRIAPALTSFPVDNVRIGAVGSDGDDETVSEKLAIIGGNLEVLDQGTLGAETLTDGDMSSTTNWAGATDWSDTISGTTTYTHSAGNGTLTQTAAQRVTGNEGSNARWYKFTYTVSAVTNGGTNVLTITNAFAASAVTLDISSNATRSVVFQAHATTADTADFVLSATSDTGSDTFTLDDLILKEIIGGDIILAGKITGGGSNGIAISGGGTVVTFETGLGTVGATETVDWRDGNHQASTLDENLTFTFIDPDGPGGFTMKLTQDGSGTNTVTWPVSVFWEGGSAPTITVAGNAVDLVSFYFDGTNYFGSVLQDMK